MSDVIISEYPSTIKSTGKFSELFATDVNGFLYEYEALQFHFHAPAEHYIDGLQHDFEMHIVHKIKPEYEESALKHGQRLYAVLGIMFDVS
jgi:carbonic anhydrase